MQVMPSADFSSRTRACWTLSSQPVPEAMGRLQAGVQPPAGRGATTEGGSSEAEVPPRAC